MYLDIAYKKGLYAVQNGRINMRTEGIQLHAPTECLISVLSFFHQVPSSYEDVDVFHLYFSVRSRTSLANVETRWVPEIRHAMPDIPILLVATNVGECIRKTVAMFLLLVRTTTYYHS